MGTTLPNKKTKGSNTPLIFGGFLIVAFIIGIGLYMYSLQCKDGEEMIEGKCLIKCTDGQTRVGVVCTTPILSNTPVLTKTIALTKDFITPNDNKDGAGFKVMEVVVRVLENGNTRTLTKDDYSSAVCDDGSNAGWCSVFPASNAIDGSTRGNEFSTGNVKPQLILTLSNAKKVVDVTVFNAGGERLKGVKLSLYSENNTLIKQCILTADATSVCTP